MTGNTHIDRFRVGIVGAGNIARSYASDLRSYSELDLVGFTDVESGRAEELAAAFGARAFADLDQLVSRVDLIVNATPPPVHAAVTRHCLGAGRHVYSEKPLATSGSAAHELAGLARRRGVRLGCAPCNLLGEAQQTAWRVLCDGKLGELRTVFAEAHGGRIEEWHASPEPFFAAGPMSDLAVYPLTLLTAMLGPVRSVVATGRVLRPRRTRLDGSTFAVTVPDFVTASLSMDHGVLVRLTTSFELPRRGPAGACVEFHGDEGRLRLDDWQLFTAAVSSVAPNGASTTVDPVRPPCAEVENGRGIREMVGAIGAGTPHRTSAEQAAHLCDVIDATARSIETGRSVLVDSVFVAPVPMPWAVP
jgi:predicted dehydrogenase